MRQIIVLADDLPNTLLRAVLNEESRNLIPVKPTLQLPSILPRLAQTRRRDPVKERSTMLTKLNSRRCRRG